MDGQSAISRFASVQSRDSARRRHPGTWQPTSLLVSIILLKQFVDRLAEQVELLERS
jgi:hypothetical protein